MVNYDFSGWATKANLKCSDGRTIMKDAFKGNDGATVPLVWNHQHSDPNEVLGHALLENRDEGVYAYCTFNETESGKTAKLLVEHGDINALSIYANQLKEHMSNVLHGNIREVSLVLAGANPGASIESIMKHGEESDEECIIYTGENISLSHNDMSSDESESLEHKDKEEERLKESAEDGADKKDKKSEEDSKKENTESKDEKTISDILDTLTDEQKDAVYALVGGIAKELNAPDEETKNDKSEGGNENMKHNVFDKTDENNGKVLSHDAMNTIISDAKRYGSLKESFLAHAAEYGIDQIEYLFPEAKSLNNPPEFIKRDTGWVSKVMSGIHHTPFSRIKSVFANITEDDARAKGYMKGNLKKEEVFSLLKRSTNPTTIYKKQKLDRDDVVDITDFDVVSWLKTEMRMMLDEEIARAILVGDGRLASSDDKIDENCIRPIISDADLYTIKKQVDVANNATDEAKAKAFIKAAIKARKDYKGSGEPTLYTTEDVVTNCLLIEDTTGRVIYDTIDKLRNVLRVKEIVTVPVMEGLKGAKGGDLVGVIVNLSDYNVGADKGGEINMFDDFDIDYNQMKYLIETRCSGALIKPYSAIALELNVAAG